MRGGVNGQPDQRFAWSAKVLALKAISKRYSWGGGLAADQVSLQVNLGEVVGLVGLNGAGKTTSLRIACGVSLPNSGEVEVDGISMLHHKKEASRLIGWVPEQPIHDPSLTVSSLVQYYSDVAGGIPDSLVDQLLDTWGMRDYVRIRFRELSLGFKRRLAVVVASLTSPKYYVLDEPFNGLDPVAMVQFRRWIQEVRNEGCGVLLSSHNLREVQFLADRVLVIHKGRLIATMKATDLSNVRRREVTVVLDRLDTIARGVLEKFGQVTISGASATIRGSEIDLGAVNTTLVRGGYVVTRLSADDSDLEEYFLNLISSTA